MAMRAPEARDGDHDLASLLDVPIRENEALSDEQRAAEAAALEESDPVGVDHATVRALIASLPDDE